MTDVLLADDHPMIAAALGTLLSGSDFRLVSRVTSAGEALAQVDALQPEILLLDVNMGESNGLDVLQTLRERGGGPAVILLTAGMDDRDCMRADRLAPEGMVLKTSDPSFILQCLNEVRSGQRWVDPDIAEGIDRARERASLAPALTRRERQLIELVSTGLRNREIGKVLGVTEGTVKIYLHAMFRRLGIENRTELAVRADELLGR